MKKLIKSITAVLSAALILSSAPAGSLSAAKQPKLSKSSITVKVNQKKKIKVKYATKKTRVKWNITGKSKNAKISGKIAKGKKASAVIIGINAGKATLKAIVKDGKRVKKLSCKITITAPDVLPAPTDTGIGSTPAPTQSAGGGNTPDPANDGSDPAKSTEAPTNEPVATDTPEPVSTSTPKPSDKPVETQKPKETNKPTATPTAKPKETNKPAATPTAPPAADKTVEADLSGASTLGGVGTVSVNADGSITGSGVDGLLIPLPVDGGKTGDTVKVTVYGSVDGGSAARMWISDMGGWNEMSNQINPMQFGVSYELVLTGTDGSAIQIKKISYTAEAFSKITITKIVVGAPNAKPVATAAPTATPEPGMENYKWVTTWGTAEENFNASPDRMPKTLDGTTVRQIVKVTTSGNRVKLRLSNQYGKSNVTIHSMHLAKQVQADKSSINTSTDTVVTVGGKEEFVIPAGKVIETDSIAFSVNALENVAISTYFGSAPTAASQMTGHRGARATTYQVSGNNVSTQTFLSPTTTLAWYFLADMSVLMPEGRAVVCFGDSITDGYGTDASYLGRNPDSYTRWGDYFAKRLQANPKTGNVAVINEGIGSNSMLGAYPTDAGKDRFRRDLLEHDGVAYCIILFGVNDLNKLNGTGKYNQLLPEYQKMVKLCHDNGIKVYGAPILPFGTSDYYSADSEKVRTMINNWMRSTESQMDGIIDFDKAVADPANPVNILEKYTHGDGLHPYDGYDVMADAIDLTMFE